MSFTDYGLTYTTSEGTIHVSTLSKTSIPNDTTITNLASPKIVSAVYEDVDKSGAVNKNDTLTVTFDQNIYVSAGQDAKDSITVGSAAFASGTINGNVLTLVLDANVIGFNVGADASIASEKLVNSWNTAISAGGAKAITSEDEIAPTIVKAEVIKDANYGESTYGTLKVEFSEPINYGTASQFSDLFTVTGGSVTDADSISLENENKTIAVTLIDDDTIDTENSSINVKTNVITDASKNAVAVLTTPFPISVVEPTVQ